MIKPFLFLKNIFLNMNLIYATAAALFFSLGESYYRKKMNIDGSSGGLLNAVV